MRAAPGLPRCFARPGFFAFVIDYMLQEQVEHGLFSDRFFQIEQFRLIIPLKGG